MDQAPHKSVSKAPKKSLAIPKHSPPDDYRAYVEHPEVATLNQVMLHYLGIEEILKLYSQNNEQFETRQALNTLAKRFDLPPARSFERLLQSYDMKYATVRSYLYHNRTPDKILMRAALEGNIQAFYNQLKLYPELRKNNVYTTALEKAAKGGHEAIIELLLELGAKDKRRTVLVSAAKGGQLELVQKELNKGVKHRYVHSAVHEAASKRHKDVVAALLDYHTTDKILTAAMEGAGYSGDIDMIEYVISRGGTNYVGLLRYADIYGHFDIIRQYWDKLAKPHIKLNDQITSNAFSRVSLEMVKFVLDKKLANQEELKGNLQTLNRKRAQLIISKRDKHKQYKLNDIDKKLRAIDSIIAYLERNGVISNDTISD